MFEFEDSELHIRSGEQFLNVERPANVIVGPLLQAFDDLIAVVERGKDD